MLTYWISRRKRITELETRLAASIAVNERLQKRAFLISIERRGRENVFTFARNGELHQISTMGLISDNIRQWKEDLLDG